MDERLRDRGSIGGGSSPSRAPLSRTTETSSRSSSMPSSERTAKTARRFGSVLAMLPESSTTKTNWAARVSVAVVAVWAAAAEPQALAARSTAATSGDGVRRETFGSRRFAFIDSYRHGRGAKG